MSGGKVVAWMLEYVEDGEVEREFNGHDQFSCGRKGGQPLVLQSDLAAAIARAEELEAMNHQQAKNIMEQETARRDAETRAEAAERDADRYRWLRNPERLVEEVEPGGLYIGVESDHLWGLAGDEADEEIDAAIAAQQAEGE